MQTLILLLLFSQISLAEPPPQPAPTPYTFNYYNKLLHHRIRPKRASATSADRLPNPISL